METTKVLKWLGLALVSFFFIWYILGHWLLALGVMLMIGLHEGGHLKVAHIFGLKTGGFWFLPIGGVALQKEVARERRQDFWIYFGGPFVGVLLVLGLSCFLHFFGSKLPPTYQGIAVYTLFLWSFINFFNLLPIFPLDGGGMLWALMKSFWKGYSPGWALFANVLGILFFFQITGSLIWMLLLLFFGTNAVLKLDVLEVVLEKEDMKGGQILFGFVCYALLILFFAVFTLWSRSLLMGL